MDQGLTSLRPARFHDLCMGGQLVLWASRHWMRAYRRGRTIPPCVWQSFSAGGLPDVYAELCGLLTIIAFREFPAEEFSRPDSVRISASEALFLGVLDSVECSDERRAAEILGTVASPAVTRAIIAQCHRLLGMLHADGHRIAQRRQDVPRESGSDVSFDDAVATVH